MLAVPTSTPRWRSALVALLAPQDCALCAAPSGNALVCGACSADLPRPRATCPVCALPSPHGQTCGACLRDPPAFAATHAAFRYAYPLDRLVHAYKYRARLPLARFLAEALVACIGAAPAVDLVVPVPLARERLRERGFNQSAEIAKRVARRLSLPVALAAFERTRATATQADLALAERARNVRSAFRATDAVIGRRLALVDDVMTSGATLEELARTATRAGALRVENWVVARAYPTTP